ncbi:hypothetical protein Tco_0205816 [Tanacetum coccineum]
MKRQGKDFSGRDTSLFPTMIVQVQEQSRRKQRKDTEDPQLSSPTKPVINDTENVASVPTHSNNPLLSGKDRLKLTELIELYTKLSERVLALETTKTNQALEIDSLKRRVKKLEKKKGLRTHRLRRLYKVGRSARVVSFEDEGLGAQEDASKQERKIDEIDQDAEVILVDETQGRYGDNLMFDTSVLDNEQEKAKKQKIDDDQEEAEMRKLIEIVPNEEDVAIDAIPLATKPPIIVDWKIIKEGKMGYFQIIRADGSSKRYSSMIQML